MSYGSINEFTNFDAFVSHVSDFSLAQGCKGRREYNSRTSLSGKKSPKADDRK